jgi:hypothetical protein
MPDPNHKAPGAQGVWIWPRAHVRAFEQLSPVNAHGDGYLLFPYALSVFDRLNRHILTVTLEQTDFRMLSTLTGERLRDLTQGMKGHLSPPVIGIYDGLTHEDLGVYEGTLDRETVFPLLVETAADKLELWEEAIRRELE